MLPSGRFVVSFSLTMIVSYLFKQTTQSQICLHTDNTILIGASTSSAVPLLAKGVVNMPYSMCYVARGDLRNSIGKTGKNLNLPQGDVQPPPNLCCENESFVEKEAAQVIRIPPQSSCGAGRADTLKHILKMTKTHVACCALLREERKETKEEKKLKVHSGSSQQCSWLKGGNKQVTKNPISSLSEAQG